MRSGRPRKLWERTAHVLVRKSKPPFDCKNPAARFSKTQERRCTVPPCSDARCTNKTFMEESVEENLTCVLIIKSIVRSMKRNIYRSLTCFGNKFCRPMKLKKKNSLATVSKGMFREKQEQHFMKRKSCQLLSMGVDLSCFRVVLQPEVQETLHRSREEWIPLNASKFWRQKSNRLKKNKKC